MLHEALHCGKVRLHRHGASKLQGPVSKSSESVARSTRDQLAAVVHNANAGQAQQVSSTGAAAKRGANELKTRLKDHMASMHSALDESDREREASIKLKQLKKEQAEIEAKKRATAGRLAAAVAREKEAEHEELTTRAHLAASKFQHSEEENVTTAVSKKEELQARREAR